MARIDPKKVLADLAKAVSELTEKISAQGVLIEVQNVKLKEQEQLIESHKKVVEKLQITVSTLNISMCAQKPLGNKSEIVLPNDEEDNKTPNVDQVSLSTTPKKPVMNERERRAANRVSKLENAKRTASSASKKKTTTPPPPPSTPPISKIVTNQKKVNDDNVGPLKSPHVKSLLNAKSNDNEWKEVRRNKRKMKPQPSVIVGTGSVTADLHTVEKLKFIQAWSFKPDTTEEQLRSHLNKIAKSEEYVVEKREIKTDRHAAFIIGMPESLYKDMISPISWPQGVRIADWFRIRPRAQRGGNSSPQRHAQC